MKKILLIIPFILFSCSSESNDINQENLKKIIKKEILDSIKSTDSLKNIKHTFKLKKGKSVLVYDNNTWEYSTKNTTQYKKDKANSSNLKTSENYISNNQVNSIASSQTTPKNNRKKKTSNSYNSYSSNTCGYPTKSGGSCRRKVKGGGTCWQHG